jgi:alpha-tubulin suppressor-like RCC1 family protein
MNEIIPLKPKAKAGPSLPPTSSSNGSESTSTADKKENVVRHSQAVAFVRNFFYALGGTLETEQAEQENTNTNAGVLVSRQWEQPSWQGLKGAAGKTRNEDESNDIQQVVCTVQSTVFLTKNGKVYQTGTLHGRVMPEAVPITIPLPLKCVQVAAGRHFCLGMMEGGLATVSWGAGHFGQLGLGANKKAEDGNLTFVPQPIVIERLLPHVIGSPMKQVACGDWHGLALTESGKVWAWGSNRSNQCGRKSAVKSGSNQAPTIVAPLPVPFDIPFSKIAAGRAHSVAITKEKAQVYCWGASAYGQCGHVLRRSGIAPPKLVEGLEDLRIIDIAAGSTHTLGLTSGGRLFSWGAGSEGQLGIGLTVGVQPKPKLVSDLDFVAIEAGQEWKNKKKKQAPGQSPFDTSTTSDESSSGSSKSTSPSALSNVPRIVSVHCAGSYSAVICSSGHVYAFGSNDVGQAGLATPENVPIKDNYILAQPPKTSTIRDLHVASFDSRHNVLLPVRVAAAKHLYVDYVACGPNHMWCVGKQRTAKQKALFVGRTLYEVQEEKRTRNLQRAKDNLLQKASRRIAEEDSESEEDVSLAESLSQLSTVQENLSLTTGAEPPGINFGTPETVRRIVSPTLANVSETTTPSTAEIAEDSAACLSPLHIKPTLSAFSSPNATRDAKAGASGRRAGPRRRFSLSNLIRRRKGKPAAENDNSAPTVVAAANGRTKRTSKRNSM